MKTYKVFLYNIHEDGEGDMEITCNKLELISRESYCDQLIADGVKIKLYADVDRIEEIPDVPVAKFMC
mgnify:FL=1|nr:hypothetical protein [uncultured Flavobacterium sp.]